MFEKLLKYQFENKNLKVKKYFKKINITYTPDYTYHTPFSIALKNLKHVKYENYDLMKYYKGMILAKKHDMKIVIWCTETDKMIDNHIIINNLNKFFNDGLSIFDPLGFEYFKLG